MPLRTMPKSSSSVRFQPDIADPTDVPGEAHLQSVPDLAGGCSMVVGLVAKAFQYPNQDVIVMVSVKNQPASGKDVGAKRGQ
jgi:hypothetical protein